MRSFYRNHMQKSSFKKGIRKLHLWLGLSTGLIVFIISITGAIYVFQEEITNYLRKDAIYHHEAKMHLPMKNIRFTG